MANNLKRRVFRSTSGPSRRNDDLTELTAKSPVVDFRPGRGRVTLTKIPLSPLPNQPSSLSFGCHASLNSSTNPAGSIIVAPSYPKASGQRLATVSNSRPLDIDGSASFDVQRRALTDWLENYSKELNLQHASSVAVEHMLFQILQGTKGLPAPNALRTAAVALLLEHMCGVVGRYEPILRTLAQEMLSAVYLPHGAVPTEEFVAERLAALGVNPTSGIQRFLSRKPYFEAFEEVTRNRTGLAARVEDLQAAVAKQAKLVLIAVVSWQRILVRIVFYAWRGTVRRERKQLRFLTRFLRRQRSHDMLQTHFYAWRCVVASLGVERAQTRYTGGIDQLIQKESAVSAKLENVEDERDEAKLVATRLKEENVLLREKLSQMAISVDSSMMKAEQWRSVTVDAVNFLGNFRDGLSIVREVGGTHFVGTGDLAVTIILGWVRSIVTKMPKGDKLKCTNFGSDLKDGKIYVVLLHVITDGAIELSNNDHGDVQSRMEVVLDALRTLNIQVPIRADDLASGTTDYAFLLLFLLWWHYALPPTPTEEVAVGGVGGFREDLVATTKYLDSCRVYYPRWLEQRAVLLDYALYVMFCRAQLAPAKVLSAQEERDIHRNFQLFSLLRTSKVPEAFLTSCPTPEQVDMNNDERERINVVIRRHVDIVKRAFYFYSLRQETHEERKGKGLKKAKAKKPGFPAAAGPEQNMVDFTGFYRLCSDCHLIMSAAEALKAEEPPEPAPKKKGSEKRKGKDEKKDEDIPVVPLKITKAHCYLTFVQVCNRFKAIEPTGASALSGLTPDSVLGTEAWVAILLVLAVTRYSKPLAATAQQPVAASVALETFLSKDLAPFACVTPTSPFLSSFWCTSVQVALQKKRRVLSQVYELHASMDGSGALAVNQFLAVLQDCGFSHYTVSRSTLVNLFRTFENPIENPPPEEEPQHLVKDSSTTPRAVTLESNTVTPSKTPAFSALSPQATPQELSIDVVDSTYPIVYAEFEMILGGLVMFISPNPFISLSEKMGPFLEEFGTGAVNALRREEKRKAAEAEAERRREIDREKADRAAKELEAKRMREAAAEKEREDQIRRMMEAATGGK